MTEVTKNVTEVAKNVCGTKNVTEVTKIVTEVIKNVTEVTKIILWGQGYDTWVPFSKTICQARFFNGFQSGACLLTQKKISEKSIPGSLKLGSQGQNSVFQGKLLSALQMDKKRTKLPKILLNACNISIGGIEACIFGLFGF